MFCKALRLICIVFIGASCIVNASGTTAIFFTQESSVKFGVEVSSGAISSIADMEKPFGEISNLSSLSTAQKSTLTQNIYLAYLFAGESMTDFRTLCLSNMITIAKSDTSLFGSDNYKITQLLYASQTDGTNIYKSARTDVVENVINRLSSAVNGDKELAQKLLQKFYGILSKDDRFKCYVPAY
ncbi:MAG: hypothetical protein LBI26_00700 [Holosporales bacterium]|jgi:hypothetical protein|nr:hypothetical protein [Holosporales bacterium]